MQYERPGYGDTPGRARTRGRSAGTHGRNGGRSPRTNTWGMRRQPQWLQHSGRCRRGRPARWARAGSAQKTGRPAREPFRQGIRLPLPGRRRPPRARARRHARRIASWPPRPPAFFLPVFGAGEKLDGAVASAVVVAFERTAARKADADGRLDPRNAAPSARHSHQ